MHPLLWLVWDSRERTYPKSLNDTQKVCHKGGHHPQEIPFIVLIKDPPRDTCRPDCDPKVSVARMWPWSQQKKGLSGGLTPSAWTVKKPGCCSTLHQLRRTHPKENGSSMLIDWCAESLAYNHLTGMSRRSSHVKAEMSSQDAPLLATA